MTPRAQTLDIGAIAMNAEEIRECGEQAIELFLMALVKNSDADAAKRENWQPATTAALDELVADYLDAEAADSKAMQPVYGWKEQP